MDPEQWNKLSEVIMLQIQVRDKRWLRTVQLGLVFLYRQQPCKNHPLKRFATEKEKVNLSPGVTVLLDGSQGPRVLQSVLK